MYLFPHRVHLNKILQTKTNKNNTKQKSPKLWTGETEGSAGKCACPQDQEFFPVPIPWNPLAQVVPDFCVCVVACTPVKQTNSGQLDGKTVEGFDRNFRRSFSVGREPGRSQEAGEGAGVSGITRSLFVHIFCFCAVFYQKAYFYRKQTLLLLPSWCGILQRRGGAQLRFRVGLACSGRSLSQCFSRW